MLGSQASHKNEIGPNGDKLRNLLLLRKRALDVRFDLDGTPYRAIETIGIGAYGVVCAAMHNVTNARIAIKKVSNIFADLITVRRAYREIAILRRLDHPNIVRVLDIIIPTNNGNSEDSVSTAKSNSQSESNKVDEQKRAANARRQKATFNDIYVCVDLLESDLHKILSSNQPLSIDHVRYFTYQLLCGLNYLHSAGIIHRDLKPSNLFVNSDCMLKIGDFGMARTYTVKYDGNQTSNATGSDKSSATVVDNQSAEKANEASSRLGRVPLSQYVATRWYRAPELLLGFVEYDSKVDMWSAGCIVGEMIGRKPLFPGENAYQQLQLLVAKLGLIPDGVLNKSASELIQSVARGISAAASASASLEPVQTRSAIERLLPNAPRKAVDLVSRMLEYEPTARINASDALEHLFVNLYRDSRKETRCPAFLSFDFDVDCRLDVTAFRDRIWEEYVAFHPEFDVSTNAAAAAAASNVATEQAGNKTPRNGVSDQTKVALKNFLFDAERRRSELQRVAAERRSHRERKERATGSSRSRNSGLPDNADDAASSSSSTSELARRSRCTSERRKRTHNTTQTSRKAPRTLDDSTGDPQATMLTDSDRQLLDRWTMLQQRAKQKQPTSNSQTSLATNTDDVIVVDDPTPPNASQIAADAQLSSVIEQLSASRIDSDRDQPLFPFVGNAVMQAPTNWTNLSASLNPHPNPLGALPALSVLPTSGLGLGLASALRSGGGAVSGFGVGFPIQDLSENELSELLAALEQQTDSRGGQAGETVRQVDTNVLMPISASSLLSAEQRSLLADFIELMQCESLGDVFSASASQRQSQASTTQ